MYLEYNKISSLIPPILMHCHVHISLMSEKWRSKATSCYSHKQAEVVQTSCEVHMNEITTKMLNSTDAAALCMFQTVCNSNSALIHTLDRKI
jgi:hypothetical protein